MFARYLKQVKNIKHNSKPFSFCFRHSVFWWWSIISSSRLQKITIVWDELGDPAKDLTGYRMFLVKEAAENILRAAGYTLLFDQSKNDGIKCVIYSTKNKIRDQQDIGSKIIITVCAPVLNAHTKCKEMTVTPEKYRKLRFDDLQEIYKNKNLETAENDEKNTLNVLTDSSIKFTFLHVKITQPVSLRLGQDSKKNRETGHKDGTFVLYNLSRLAAIRKKYLQFARDGFYPYFTDPQKTDFSVLTQFEEWQLLFNFLLEFPTVVSRCANDIANGKPAIHRISQFIFSLCSSFSVYYRKYRILLEPKDHLMHLLKARIFLAMSIEQVLENSLALLGIKKVQEM